MATPIRAVPQDIELDPRPPSDIFYFRLVKAWIPMRTRDGRQWTGGGPDAYGVLKIGEQEVIRTPIQTSTHQPSWPDSQGGNFRVKRGQKVVAELWDDGTFQEYPIGAKEVDDLQTAAVAGQAVLGCDSGARITLEIEPARAQYGVGLWYELREHEVYITRTIKESPAGRAGLRAGQRILKIQGAEVGDLDEGQVRSLINGNLRTGLIITALQSSGETRTAELREGPIYMLAGEEKEEVARE